MPILQQQCGKQVVCNKYHYAANNYGNGAGPANFQRATLYIVAIISRYATNDKGKCICLA